MLWGYYFTSDSKFPLAITRRVLGFLGYRFVDLSRHDDDRVWWLHLERTEVHDLYSLSIRDAIVLACQFVVFPTTTAGTWAHQN